MARNVLKSIYIYILIYIYIYIYALVSPACVSLYIHHLWVTRRCSAAYAQWGVTLFRSTWQLKLYKCQAISLFSNLLMQPHLKFWMNELNLTPSPHKSWYAASMIHITVSWATQWCLLPAENTACTRYFTQYNSGKPHERSRVPLWRLDPRSRST